MVGEVGDSQIIVNLPVTNVPGCIGSNAKTLGLQHPHFRDVGASGGPPDGTRIVHHGTDELLLQQNNIPDGETASSVQEGSQRSHSVCRFLSHLLDVFRRDGAFIKGHPKITGVTAHWIGSPKSCTDRACLQAAGKYIVRKVALSNTTRKERTLKWKMLQGPIGNTVWAWCLADFETPKATLTSVGLVSLG